jgi:hypothetical protein
MTQMGIQGSSGFSERLAVAMIQNGSIGKVTEVHTFSEKKWGDTELRPRKNDVIPPELDWDHWLGVAAPHDYIADYDHPQNWRKRRSFGTGTLGDMGCHMFSGWFRALDLAAPVAVKSTGPKPNADNWAIDGRVEYTFAGTPYTEADSLKVIWYDGDANCHPDVAPAVEQAMKVLADAGAIVEEIRLSDLLVYQDCKTTISITEMFSAYEHEFRTRPQDFGLMFRNKVLSGSLIRAEDYFQALRQRLWLARELSRAFREYDVIATAGWMTPADKAHPDKLEKFLRPPNITTPFNIGGGPAMNIPCGFSTDGLPLSLQIAADHFDEPMMFRVGHAYQQLTDWHQRRPTEGMHQ